MAEEKKVSTGKGILPEKSIPGLDSVLRFTDEQNKFRVRLLGPQFPVRAVWRHTTRLNNFGQSLFIKSLCTAQFSGDVINCALCKVNSDPKYLKVDNKLKPHPRSSEWVQAVYVHDLKEVKLLVGYEVWSQIDTLAREHDVLVYERDLQVVRLYDKRYTYSVKDLDPQPLDLAQVCKGLNPDVMIQEYTNFLRGNINRVTQHLSNGANVEQVQPAEGSATSGTPAAQPVSNDAGPGTVLFTTAQGAAQPPQPALAGLDAIFANAEKAYASSNAPAVQPVDPVAANNSLMAAITKVSDAQEVTAILRDGMAQINDMRAKKQPPEQPASTFQNLPVHEVQWLTDFVLKRAQEKVGK